jgi:hypothetical protein
MHDRTNTPDILGSIMSGIASNKAVKQESYKESKAQEEEEKEKATFNLPIKLLSELEDKCHSIRKMCQSKQVSKTLLVEEALRMAFLDFEIKSDSSAFFQRIKKNKAIKQ